MEQVYAVLYINLETFRMFIDSTMHSFYVKYKFDTILSFNDEQNITFRVCE